MKKIIAPAIAGVLVLGLLAGCDGKEREALQQQVASLQQELVTANNSLAAKESELSALRTELQAAKDSATQIEAQLATLTAEMEAAQAELAKFAKKKK